MQAMVKRSLFLSSLWAYASFVQCVTAVDCISFFNQILEESARSTPLAITTLDDLLNTFTQGLEPDLTNPVQQNAFEIYRHVRFGNPNADISSNSLERIANVQKKYPELKKEPFRNYVALVEQRFYPVSDELSGFLNSQLKSMGKIKSNLFQVDANEGFWKKALGYRQPGELEIRAMAGPGTSLNKMVRKELARQHWNAFFDSRFPGELRAYFCGWATTDLETCQKALRVYGQSEGAGSIGGPRYPSIGPGHGGFNS